MTDFQDNEDRMESREDRRRDRKPTGCHCFGEDEAAGTCPGALNCPYSDFAESEYE